MAEERQDKRQNIRIGKSLEVSYRISKKLFRDGSRSVDISKGGMRLPVPRHLQPGTMLELEIRPLMRKSISVIGKVIWLNEKRIRNFPFEVGIKFTEIASSDSENLHSLCEEIKDRNLADIKWID